MATRTKKTEVGDPTNGGQTTIEAGVPYIATIGIQGSADLLFHRWNCDSVEAKSKAAKGSTAKKTDDVESYVYRDGKGELCLPGEYLRMAIINAAKYKQDPRSPRKSAMDIFKAGVVSITPLASLGVKDWDYEHRCRVMIQRSAVTRTRPALKAGWKAEVQLMVMIPEYIPEMLLNAVTADAGRLVGVGDFRPTFGRFQVVKFEVA